MDTEALAALGARLEAGEIVDAAGVALEGVDPFAGQVLGLIWDSLAFDRCAAHLDVDRRHHQPHGIVHGGVWCAVVESLGSLAGTLRVAARGRQVVGVSNVTDFVRPHREGRVDAAATPLHVGRTQQLWEVRIVRARDGRLIARGQVRLQTVDPAADR